MTTLERLRQLHEGHRIQLEREQEDWSDDAVYDYATGVFPYLPALLAIAEAAGRGNDALDDAIKANVNGDAGWTQDDYDEWDAARTNLREALTRLEQP